MALPTNFKDDILKSGETKRKYKMINNPDGTVSFDDVTNYQQVGSDFGAKQVNETNKAINNITDKTLGTLNEVIAATQKGFWVDALAVKELFNKSPEIIPLTNASGLCFKWENGMMIQCGIKGVSAENANSTIFNNHQYNIRVVSDAKRIIPFKLLYYSTGYLAYTETILVLLSHKQTNDYYITDNDKAMGATSKATFNTNYWFFDIGTWK